MILYIVRHAWAEPRDDQQWPDDALRPLTKKGRKRFAKLVRALGARRFSPQLVLTSPLVRCRQTADLIAENLSGEATTVDRPELAPNSDLEALVAWTAREAKDLDEVAWVGHAPDVGHLAAALIGDPRCAIEFAKGAVAAIEFDGLPTVGGGSLLWLVTARVLGI